MILKALELTLINMAYCWWHWFAFISKDRNSTCDMLLKYQVYVNQAEKKGFILSKSYLRNQCFLLILITS